MTASGIDLTGDWTGIYNYPVLYPPNRFDAALRDDEGWISGTTSESDAHPAGNGAVLHAVIDGRRDGSTLLFVKVYEDETRMPDIVRYEGLIESCGDEISGQWEVPGVWSGTFLMIRGARAAASIERQVSEVATTS